MRWWTVAVLVVATACGRKNFDDAGSDGTNGSGSNDVDSDGDGTVNAQDNCPHLFNGNQNDGDGDGVGDSCDPHPGAAGDKLVALGLFDTSFGDWSPDLVSNWLITNGAARTTPAPDSTSVRLSITTTANQPSLQLSYVVDDYGPTIGDEISIYMASGAENLDCQIGENNSSPVFNQVIGLVNSSYFGSVGLAPVMVGSANTLTMNWSGGTFGCIHNGMPMSSTKLGPTSTSLTVTLEVRAVKAGFRYAALYSSP